ILLYIATHIAYSGARVLIGQAAEVILNSEGRAALLQTSLAILFVLLFDGVTVLLAAYSVEVIAKRVERDSREELYASLLGKSQTFHDRQRVGDIMARATDDMQQISGMIMPGLSLIFDSMLGIVVPLSYIALIEPRILLVPLLFVAAYFIALRDYTRRLSPVTQNQRMQYGKMNSALEETISGIELVKASAQEAFERLKFRGNARLYRDYFVQQGEIEARYLPLLLYGIALGLTFAHALWLYNRNALSIPDIIAIMGLMGVLAFPTFISIFTFSLVQLGLASAERILAVIKAETEVDENAAGYAAPVRGDIRFENVTFGYGGKPILQGITFHIEPGQTIAIVGQTGSGKSTLTQLVNRTYDVTEGRILIDGVDVRDWNLDSLRSQISKIEQDIFLFARSVADNIAFGAPDATPDEVEEAARDA
ncbi:MAG: ABC transporter ATP-binding protein, partial [Ardenticatenaceae bacterium]